MDKLEVCIFYADSVTELTASRVSGYPEGGGACWRMEREITIGLNYTWFCSDQCGGEWYVVTYKCLFIGHKSC